MCKYCEPLTVDTHDISIKYRDFLPTRTFSNDIDNHETMSAIIPPTPISKHKHQDDGFVSEIEIYFADDKRRVTHIYIPIKYCPMCGKEIK